MFWKMQEILSMENMKEEPDRISKVKTTGLKYKRCEHLCEHTHTQWSLSGLDKLRPRKD